MKFKRTAQTITYETQLNAPTVIDMLNSGKPLIPALSADSTSSNSNFDLLQAAIEYSRNKNATTSNQPILPAIEYHGESLHNITNDNTKSMRLHHNQVTASSTSKE